MTKDSSTILIPLDAQIGGLSNGKSINRVMSHFQ